MNEKLKALKAAFPGTIPVMTGFLFLGMAFGIGYVRGFCAHTDPANKCCRDHLRKRRQVHLPIQLPRYMLINIPQHRMYVVLEV